MGLLTESQPDTSVLPQREALEEEPGYVEEGTGLDEMDIRMATSADQYDTFEEDEDQLYMQQAPSDTLIALQLLRSQFPAKARVGTFQPSAGARAVHMHSLCLLNAMYLAGKPLQLHVQEVVQPFMLRSQLYSLVDDRTLVDRELDDLRCDLRV